MKKILTLACISALLMSSCSTDNDATYDDINAKDFDVIQKTTVAGKASGSLCASSPLMVTDSDSAGEVYLKSDGTYLYITYKVATGWQIDATNLYLGEHSDIPTYSSGNPRINLFPYRSTHGNKVNEVVYKVKLDDIPTECFTFIGHAVVTKLDPGTGAPVYCTHSWADGEPFGPHGKSLPMCKYGCSNNAKQPVIPGR
ncbi:hypothetical protein [Gilvibacter sp.]|uniref:hypothetical protein n=1 Tax=Gilvibacter sp. TaxID=2729997 RepID=UPI003F49D877